jgi:hypothetical protein
MVMVKTLALFAAAAVALAGRQSVDADYRADVEAFRAHRESEINGPTGWGALVGLHFLRHGTQTIGRDAANDVVLSAPSAPGVLGRIAVGRRTVAVHLAPGVDGRWHDQPAPLIGLAPGRPAGDGLVVGSMTMVVIQRGGRMALRVWDTRAPVVASFTGLQWYPIDPGWRIDARFVPLDPEPTVPILNVLDETIQMRQAGFAEFSLGGQDIRLIALKESDDAEELFFMFRDGTSGGETYAAGRYLYTPLPADGRVTLDFNKAKNPPCTFTDYATCPLPPAQNRLSVAIRAGERNYGVH